MMLQKMSVFSGLKQTNKINPSFLFDQNILHSRRDPSSIFNVYLMSRFSHIVSYSDASIVREALSRYGFCDHNKMTMLQSTRNGMKALIARGGKDLIVALGYNGAGLDSLKVSANHGGAFFGIGQTPVIHPGLQNLLRDFDEECRFFECIDQYQTDQTRCFYVGYAYGGALATLCMNTYIDKEDNFLFSIAPIKVGNNAFINLLSNKFGKRIFSISSTISIKENPYFNIHSLSRVEQYSNYMAHSIGKTLLNLTEPEILSRNVNIGMASTNTVLIEAQKRAAQEYHDYVISSVDHVVCKQTEAAEMRFTYKEQNEENIIPKPKEFDGGFSARYSIG